jgi:hypothetical protein
MQASFGCHTRQGRRLWKGSNPKQCEIVGIPVCLLLLNWGRSWRADRLLTTPPFTATGHRLARLAYAFLQADNLAESLWVARNKSPRRVEIFVVLAVTLIPSPTVGPMLHSGLSARWWP